MVSGCVLEPSLLSLVKQVPGGKVTTYGALARALGDPIAARWVGKVLSENYRSDVPCHRVIMSDLSLGGYNKGVDEKVKKLKEEGIDVAAGRVNEKIFEDFVTSYPLRRYAETQLKLAQKVVLEGDLKVGRVAGIDVSYREGGKGVCSIFDLSDGSLIEELTIVKRPKFPYIPTYLSFREGGFIIELVKMMSKEERKDCILLIDGNGYMHPRKCGLASHVGVVLDMPTIGVAKSRLCGKSGEKGEIYINQELVGFAIGGNRYVSPGHRVSAYGSRRFVRRLLEAGIAPLRRAHRTSRP